MPILIRDGGIWKTVSDPQVRDNNAWKQVQSAHVRDAGSWKQVYARSGPTPPPPPPPGPTSFNQPFPVESKQVYWNSGNQDNQTSTIPHMIQGTWDGTTGNRRFTLAFFNINAIRSFLAGANITEVYFGVKRVLDSPGHGTTSSTIRVGTTAADSAIPSWTGTGVTARGSASLTRGQFLEVPLTSATGAAFRDGAAGSIALGSNAMSLSLGEYGRYELAGAYIRFIGTK